MDNYKVEIRLKRSPMKIRWITGIKTEEQAEEQFKLHVDDGYRTRMSHVEITSGLGLQFIDKEHNWDLTEDERYPGREKDIEKNKNLFNEYLKNQKQINKLIRKQVAIKENLKAKGINRNKFDNYIKHLTRK